MPSFPAVTVPAPAPFGVRRTAAHAPRRPVIGLLGDAAAAQRVTRAAHALGVDTRLLPERAPAARRPASALAGAPELVPCDVVTALAEHVPAERLALAAGADQAMASARPAPSVLAVAQDRAREKSWLDARAGHAAPWRLARDVVELRAAVAALLADDDGSVGLDVGCVLKLRRRRVDGPRPIRIVTPDAATAAWEAMGARACVVERALAIEAELVVLVARTPRGALAVYPVAQTLRAGTVPVAHLVPAPVHASVARKAQRTAAFYAAKLAVEGLLAVELFVLADGRMVVNELVPAPHPAFDAADVACETGQHEQLVRAVCDLPLGATDLVTPAACVPLAGVGRSHVLAADLAPGCGVWYHAPEAGGGGHLVASGANVHAALERARHEALRLARLARGAACDDATDATDATSGARHRNDAAHLPGTPWQRRFAAP